MVWRHHRSEQSSSLVQPMGMSFLSRIRCRAYIGHLDRRRIRLQKISTNPPLFVRSPSVEFEFVCHQQLTSLHLLQDKEVTAQHQGCRKSTTDTRYCVCVHAWVTLVRLGLLSCVCAFCFQIQRQAVEPLGAVPSIESSLPPARHLPTRPQSSPAGLTPRTFTPRKRELAVMTKTPTLSREDGTESADLSPPKETSLRKTESAALLFHT